MAKQKNNTNSSKKTKFDKILETLLNTPPEPKKKRKTNKVLIYC